MSAKYGSNRLVFLQKGAFMQKEKICRECGALFIANYHNVKYCDSCKPIVKARKEKEWRDRTDANGKQREKARLRLFNERAQRNEEIKKRKEEFEETASRITSEKERKLIEEAEQGDAVANMILSLRNGGKYNKNYWYWFKQKEIQYNEKINKKPTLSINGVHINDPDFEESVIDSINDMKCITLTHE